MSRYTHLTPYEREKIYLLYNKNYSICKIAKVIGRNKSTVSRELSRNSNKDDYSPTFAQSAYIKRRKRSRRKLKLSDPDLFNFVKTQFLDNQWSPEQIAGRLKLENGYNWISYSTIYRAIYKRMFDSKEQINSKGNRGAIRKLRHRGKTRSRKGFIETRGKIRISNNLADRPEEANNRERIGDWEGDTVAGKTGGACLVTLVDRKSRFLLACKSNRKVSDDVRDCIIRCLDGQPCHSITPDRGKEFSKHADVTKALGNVPFYFPLPHHPWDRGTNENTNGLLREYFPKGIDMNNFDDSYIDNKVDKINRRPRKSLGFRTPFEIYYDVLLHFT